MNNIIISFIITLIAGLSTLLGYLIIYLKISKEKQDSFICLCLSFTMTFMILISVFELIPKFFLFSIFRKGFIKTTSIIIFIYLICSLLFKYINKIMYRYSNNNLYKLGILNMLILMVHNIPEGIITFMSSIYNPSLGLTLSMAIALHNIPEGISIAVPIYYATNSKLKAFNKVLISSLAEPFGALLTYIFLKDYINNNLINYILLFVGILMLTLSTMELLPKVIEYKNKKMMFIGIILGILIFTITFIFHV